jgi:hypothetical protein
MIRFAVTVVLGCLLAVSAYHEGQSRLRWGAPPLPYHCPAGSHVVRHWVPGPATASGEISWGGQHEWAACAASTTVSTG